MLALAAIPLLTGFLDLALGLAAPRMIGAALSAQDATDPLLNSQIRFFGAVWCGVGALMARSVTDLPRFGPLLDTVFAALIVAGIGRAVTILEFGLPASTLGQAFVWATTSLELAGLPLMILWRRMLPGSPRSRPAGLDER